MFPPPPSPSPSSPRFAPFPSFPSRPLSGTELVEDFGVPPSSRRGRCNPSPNPVVVDIFFLRIHPSCRRSSLAVARTIVGSFVYECVVATRWRNRTAGNRSSSSSIHPSIRVIHRSTHAPVVREPSVRVVKSDSVSRPSLVYTMRSCPGTHVPPFCLIPDSSSV